MIYNYVFYINHVWIKYEKFTTHDVSCIVLMAHATMWLDRVMPHGS